jgi:hypothetical protein
VPAPVACRLWRCACWRGRCRRCWRRWTRRQQRIPFQAARCRASEQVRVLRTLVEEGRWALEERESLTRPCKELPALRRAGNGTAGGQTRREETGRPEKPQDRLTALMTRVAQRCACAHPGRAAMPLWPVSVQARASPWLSRHGGYPRRHRTQLLGARLGSLQRLFCHGAGSEHRRPRAVIQVTELGSAGRFGWVQHCQRILAGPPSPDPACLSAIESAADLCHCSSR